MGGGAWGGLFKWFFGVHDDRHIIFRYKISHEYHLDYDERMHLAMVLS
jgi:hypothetical protein